MDHRVQGRGDPRGYRVVGFLTGAMGLGVAARNTVRALEASGRPVARVTLQNRWARGASAARPPSPAGADNVTVFHVNPPDIASYRAAWRDDVARVAPRVCVPFWELPLVPADWVPVLGALDAVLAPTRFIQEACAAAIGAARVLHYPQAVFAPPAVPARDAWGFGRGSTVFLVSFDIGSDIDRKNPAAAIEAFRRAFPADPDVRLVIKTKPWKSVPAFRAQLRELVDRVSGDARITVLERSLEDGELLSLYASCDVMLALHRSEGLGLHLMEAMSLGKPVVATGWSGNMDFMTARNSVPVRYALGPVRSRHDAYAQEAARPGQVWAEPDVAHAAEALRALHVSPERRAALGATAAKDMEERQREVLSGETFERLEAALPASPRGAGAFDRALLETRGRLYWKAIRGLPRALARRAGLSGA